ncbi:MULTISPECIES: hypothetical protein [Amniculibacterium]|jgi:Mg/Co/Ni transporter MgtE|uniref:hypothetical protein n=1 Tax=Amniculibacterium TaxID=2715289 RepID=UPI000F5AB5FE|nr:MULTISPECIES: hypothetical protein [Amniculibacterium]
MKARRIVTVLCLFCASLAFAQQLTTDAYRSMSKEQRKEAFDKLSMSEKKMFIRQMREDHLVKELQVSPSNDKQFRQLFHEYMESQRVIKDRFKHPEDSDKMTEQEAKLELENSFVVGQKLMDNRKKYTQEFLKILSPKQVLKLFHNEMKMREKIDQHRKRTEDR